MIDKQTTGSLVVNERCDIVFFNLAIEKFAT